MPLAKEPVSAARTLRALAALLAYPGTVLRSHLAEVRGALHSEAVLVPQRLAQIDVLIDTLGGDPYQVEADYVELFDRDRATSLHLFEHVHGDSRDRGPAMVDLAKTYEAAGLYLAPGELPDYLPAVLEFASTRPPREAAAFLGETAHILTAIYSSLMQRRSVYASVLAALLELAGEKVEAKASVAADEPLDASWAEPPVFGGCSTSGQARPGTPQPIQIIRKSTKSGAAL